MRKSSSEKKDYTLKTFETASVVELDRRLPYSRVAIPSEEAVIDAKEWVDSNEK